MTALGGGHSIIKGVRVSRRPLRFILTGFMGAGKSTIGRLLAKALDYDFVDTDRFIEREQGVSCGDVFEKLGEAHFRQLEREVLNKHLEKTKIVISTGGGTLANPDTMAMALKRGHVIYLKAPVDYLFERIMFSPRERPILREANPEALFREKYKAREATYSRAHTTVSTHLVQPEEVVEAILAELKLSPAAGA